jgi:transcriptional regulator with XRE-family HTH domain
MMNKLDFNQHFAFRLRQSMIDAGFASMKSTSGVNLQSLVDITGYSLQICRKYLRGEAIPEPLKLLEIAQALNISPGWLLYGDSPETASPKQGIKIQPEILEYILLKSHRFMQNNPLGDESPRFLLDLIQRISQIKTEDAQSRQIIDLAFASLQHVKF